MARATGSFGKGFGATATSVGILIALGAMIGKLLADSGGADRIVDTLLRRGRRYPATIRDELDEVGPILRELRRIDQSCGEDSTNFGLHRRR